MERITEVVYPDGRVKTVTEKEGLVVRDLIFGAIGMIGGGVCGGFVGSRVAEAIPVGETLLEKGIRAVAIGSAGLATEHVVGNAISESLSDVADLGEDMMSSIRKKTAVKPEQKEETIEEEPKAQPKQKTVRDAKK